MPRSLAKTELAPSVVREGLPPSRRGERCGRNVKRSARQSLLSQPETLFTPLMTLTDSLARPPLECRLCRVNLIGRLVQQLTKGAAAAALYVAPSLPPSRPDSLLTRV